MSYTEFNFTLSDIMKYVELNLILSFIGTLASTVNNITPLRAILNRIKQNTVKEIPLIYIGLNHISQISWLFYSIKVNRHGLMLVNTLTSLLSFTNFFLCIYYTKKLISSLRIYTVCLIILGLISVNLSVEYLGSTCFFLSIVSSVSNIESIFRVIGTQNHNYIDLGMALSNLFRSFVWGLYGLINQYWPVTWSNFARGCIGVALILVKLYYQKFKKMD
jgi:uncharacterized protein with PQ loop repeat